MKLSIFFAPTIFLGLGAALIGADEKYQPPVPITQGPPPAPAAPTEGAVYEQRLYSSSATLVSPERANQVLESFRPAYEKLGKPRILFYVNRDLVDEHSGLKLTGRKEKTETTVTQRKSSFESDGTAGSASSSTTPSQVNVNINGTAGSSHAENRPGKGSADSRTSTVSGENTYAASEKTAPTLADKLTVREIETLVGRPFRAAGVTLADQKVASSTIADQPIDHFTTATNESARKDREALAKVADVVIEVLVSSRTASVAAVSGEQSVSVPDIQLTAIRLSDAAVLGQASSADVLGKDAAAARTARRFGVRDITEATALALMEDLATAAK